MTHPIDTADLRALLGEYRATMDREVLHSWAADVLSAFPALLDERDALLRQVEGLREALRPFALADIDVSGTAAVGVTRDAIIRAADTYRDTLPARAALSKADAS